jgi:hypothetical protein
MNNGLGNLATTGSASNPDRREDQIRPWPFKLCSLRHMTQPDAGQKCRLYVMTQHLMILAGNQKRPEVPRGPDGEGQAEGRRGGEWAPGQALRPTPFVPDCRHGQVAARLAQLTWLSRTVRD